MRSHFKKIGVLMMALVLALTLTVPAFAASEAGSLFTDVPVDSPWFEGVEYIADRGITVGTGEGRYSPDSPITARQWAVMLCRAYDKTDALEILDGEFGKNCLTESYRSGWLSVEALTEPDIVPYPYSDRASSGAAVFTVTKKYAICSFNGWIWRVFAYSHFFFLSARERLIFQRKRAIIANSSRKKRCLHCRKQYTSR